MNSDASTPKQSIRYCCPYPGCNRSFRDFWRLKVHYRALPGARGSGVERGHGQELPHCPLCLAKLDDVKYHKCSAGPAASGGGRRSSSGASQSQQAAAVGAAVNAGLVSSGSVGPLTAVRPTITWPQHLSVSTGGPVQLQSYGSNSMGGMNQNGQPGLVTTMSHQQPHQPTQQQQAPQQQPQMVQTVVIQQQQHQQMQQQPQMQQQHSQQLRLPSKQLWVQTNAASGPTSSNGTVGSFQQQQQQHQQYPQQQQQQQAWVGQQVSTAPVQYAQPNGMQLPQQQQQQVWQQQAQVPAQAPVTTQQFGAVAATPALQHVQPQQHQQQQQPLQPLQIATQLLGPALGTLQYQQHLHPQQQQQQQLDQAARQLSPVITLPSNHPSNTGSTLYRPSPRLSGDGCLSSFLLPRLSADGCLGGSQWTPKPVAAGGTVPSAAPGAASAFAAAAASAFKQPGAVCMQQQQQGQTVWAQQVPQGQQQQQQPQQQGAVTYYQAATGKVSNNSGSSSSGEWHPAPQSAVQQSGALSGLIQGFAAEMQARAYQQQQQGTVQQQQQQQQPHRLLQQDTNLAPASNGHTYASYGPSILPLSQTWFQQPGASAAAGAGNTQQAAPLPAAAAAVGAPTDAPGAAAAVGADGPQGLAGGLQLPEFALRIAEEFKSALGALRSSMVCSTDVLQPADEGANQGPAQVLRVGSSSGSNSPVNSSGEEKGPLPGSCQSMLQAGQQLPSSPAGAGAGATAAADGDTDTQAGGSASNSSQGAKRPAEDCSAPASPNSTAEQQVKKVKLSPGRTGSAQLPPLGSSGAAAAAARSASASGSPPRHPAGTLAGAICTPSKAPAGPFAAAATTSGGCACSQEGMVASGLQRAPSAGLTRTCSVWSDTPPPPEAPAALLELAAQMHRETVGLPDTVEAAAAGAAGGLDPAAWQQQEQHGLGEVSATAAAELAAAAQQLLTLPVPGSCDDQCGGQKHRALVAGLMKKATDDARVCGLADPSPLVAQLMSILDDHVAALSQLGSPAGTELGVASAGGVSVQLPNAPSVGGAPVEVAAGGTDQYANSGVAAVGFVAAPAAVSGVPQS